MAKIFFSKDKYPMQDELKRILDYDSETGIFTWKVANSNSNYIGRIAGSLNSGGYRLIKIDGTLFTAHRLAWLYTYGYIPENEIDHINRKRDDNRIKNLREISLVCQARNKPVYNNNTSGVKGVVWDKQALKWNANIFVGGKRKNLGRFINFIDAVCHRFAAEQCLNWAGCDSSSSAYKYLIKTGVITPVRIRGD